MSVFSSNGSATLSEEIVFKEFNSSKEGLTVSEAKFRLLKNGPNKVLVKNRRGALVIFLSQFQNWLILALLFATAVSFFLGDQINSLVILSLVVLSSILGFFQEYRSERALDKLKEYITFKCRVMREGCWFEQSCEDLVIGDVVELRIGDRVPADLRIIVSDNLEFNESILTGESALVAKRAVLSQKDLEDPRTLALMGTFVSSGFGRGVVESVGDNTSFGKTAKIIREKPPLTDFQKQTKKLSFFLFRIIFVLTVFVFTSDAFFGRGLIDSFLFALALTVGVAPELLPLIMTITLSQGALKMAKKKVIIKRLMSVEDFGNMDTLCVDKTGTLTEGVFTLTGYVDPFGQSDQEVLLEAVLCSSGFSGGRHGFSSNPTDRALWDSPDVKKISEKINKYYLLDVNEFDYSRKRISVVVSDGLSRWLISKGAPENIIDVCNIDDALKSKLFLWIQDQEARGFRVLAVAKKQVDFDESETVEESNLVFRGFVLYSDPIKASASAALVLLRDLGVGIKIISGDSPLVVKKAAQETGLFQEDSNIITGKMLEGFSKFEFEEALKNCSLFARVTPAQKFDIVSGLNQDGHVVGFLGDGVNDAPALKAADVGVSVDSGSEVAKEAADIILLEKDLRTLAEGIEEGRKTFGNVSKYILNTVSANFGNMFTVAAASLFLPFIPLLPSQILLTNFISDFPLLAIASDRVDHDYTVRPRRWDIKMIFNFMVYFGFISAFFDFLLIIPLIFFFKVPPAVFRTAWFVESTISEIVITFAIRTKLPFYKSTPSKLLILASLVFGLVTIIVPSLGFGRHFFEFTSLPSLIWLWIGVELIIYFLVTEVIKYFFFSKFKTA